MAASGAVHGVDSETWVAIDRNLRLGQRGLPGGGSLARFLEEHGRKRNLRVLPPLTVKRILDWADAHHRRTGDWPTHKSSRVHEAPAESWMAIDQAMFAGRRGLPRRTTLIQLLAKHRGRRNPSALPRLTMKKILAWADEYRERSGEWPTSTSGAVQGSSGESWLGINSALDTGRRGLKGGSSLAQLLAKHRNKPNPMALPRLTIKQILAWADAYDWRNGKWPKKSSGPIPGSSRETWSKMDTALHEGLRGLSGGSSLPQLLAKHRGVRHIHHQPPLTIKQILKWADAHRRHTGLWPTPTSGEIARSGGESWNAVHSALFRGVRGMRRGSTLAKVLARHRGVGRNKRLP